ncbi:hypothetical protein PC112_g16932 [Phytophthora cactorum]|nr:hypothetical protein PC112_g16932 [Phytophthora cactorum]
MTGKATHTPTSGVVLASKPRIAFVKLKKGERCTVKWKLGQNTPSQVVESDEASNAVPQESEIDHGRTEPIEVAQLQSTGVTSRSGRQREVPRDAAAAAWQFSRKTKEGALSKTESTITREAAVDNVQVLRLPASLGLRSKESRNGAIASKFLVCFKKRFLLSRSPTVLQKRASEVLAETNFVIPVKLLERVYRALLSWISQQAEFEDVDPSHDDVVPAAFVTSEMGGFSMTYVRWLLQYYALMAIVDEYRMDLAWLQGNWSEFTTMKHKFLEKTPASPTGLAEEVAQLLRQSSLSRTFTTPSGPTGRSVTSSLRRIVGKIARKKRFNDAVMKAALWHVYKLLCCRRSLRYRRENNRTVYPLASCNYVLVSIHMVALRPWIIQIVEVQMGDQAGYVQA